jgi:hypothetical protein
MQLIRKTDVIARRTSENLGQRATGLFPVDKGDLHYSPYTGGQPPLKS